MIKAETLEKVMVSINKIAQAENLEDFSKARTDAKSADARKETSKYQLKLLRTSIRRSEKCQKHLSRSENYVWSGH